MLKNIFLDTRWIRGDRVDGISRVCLSYIKELVKNNNYNFTLMFFNEKTKDILIKEIGQKNSVSFQKVNFDIVTIKDFIFLPLFLNKNKADFYFSFNYLTPPFRLRQKSAILVHDFIPYLFPQEFKKASLKWKIFFGQKWFIKRMIKLRDYIFSVSDSTKNDVISLFGISENKIITIHNSTTLAKNTIEKSPFGEHAKEDYLLYVGRKDKYKNVETVIKCFLSLDIKENLVICGPEDKLFYSDMKVGYGKDKNWNKIIFINNISDSELLYIYKHAKLLINVSLYEGFGLPVLEAMSLDVPVICSNGSSLSEIAGDAAYLVDPRNHDQIKKAIEYILGNQVLMESLVKKGQTRSNDFSWDKSSSKIINKINEALE